MESQRLRAFRRPVIDAEFSTFEEKPWSRNSATGARDHTRAQQPCTGADLAFKFRLQPGGQPADAMLSGNPGRIGELGIGDEPLSRGGGGQGHGGALLPPVVILLSGACHDPAFLDAARGCDP